MAALQSSRGRGSVCVGACSILGRINAQIEQTKGHEAEMLAAYRLAALHATEDVEKHFFGLGWREEQATVLARGVDSLARARAALVCCL